MRKGGRPKATPEQKRTPTPVRLNDEERELMARIARDEGLGLSTWMRVVLIAEARELERLRRADKGDEK